MATRIGVSNFHYAMMTKEETLDTPPTYGKPISAPGLMSLNINPNAGMDTLFADDGPFETATTIGQIEVEVQKNALTTQNKADLLCKVVDSKGGLISSSTDIPPWVAIGFKSLKSNGKYRYCWLYKGKFMDPEDNNETKGDSINWQSDTITGNFVKLIYQMTVAGKLVCPWKYDIDEDDIVDGEENSVDTDTIAKWFDSVVMPTPDAAITTVSNSPASTWSAGSDD